MRKKYNPNLAKIHRSYTVKEVADLYGVHRNTIGAWCKAGLVVCDDRRPVLILGSDLRLFLQERRASRKQPCAPGELYCTGCKQPKLPAEQMVDYMAITPTKGRLVGLCPTCGNTMNRFISKGGLRQVADQLDVMIMRT